MKANEIKVGGIYRARISGNFVDVRVDAIRETTKRGRSSGYSGLPNYVDAVVYDVTNLTTGRRTTFKSTAKFRGEVKPVSRLEGKLKDLAEAGRRGSITPEEQDAQHTAILIAEVNARQGREMEEAIGPIPEPMAYSNQDIDQQQAKMLAETRTQMGW